jgi:addiction module HigA family antidote
MTHPGQILAQHLIDLGLTASDLARDIGVPVNRVTAIINGQRGVTADTALRLGHWFGVEPEVWLELQMQYELAVARREEVRPELFDVVPRLASLRQYLIRQAGERCAFTMQLPALALQLGATDVVNASEVDAVAAVREMQFSSLSAAN